MPARIHKIGSPCWVDLLTSDADRSRAFYAGLFGWTAGEPAEELGGYFMFIKEGEPVAGAMGVEAGSAPTTDVWSVYLASDDARKTMAAAEAGGGQVAVPAMEVADLGTMGMVIDAGSAAIGIWQARGFAGIATVAEPGTAGWFELHTRDYERAVAFYRDVFGWDTRTMSDTPEFRYTTLGEGESSQAGIMDATAWLPQGVAAHWSVYFTVADTDAALARAVDLGGTVVAAAEDTPWGRMATAADPNGTRFKLSAGG